MWDKKKILYSALGGIISTGSIGGAIAFAFVWKGNDNDSPNSPKSNNIEINGRGNISQTSVAVPTATKKSLKNLPQTIKELKTKYPSYYGSLSNALTKQPLFDALNSIQKKYRSKIGSYGDLWTTYQKAFKDQYDEKDGTMYDIYSEKVDGVDDFNFHMPQNQNRGRHSKPGDSYNREHLIPQSIFGKHAAHVHNDAHFVYPTDSAINGIRSNFSHDKVIKATKEGKNIGGNNWKLGVGKNTNGATAFEPDDHFKGDVARAYLYFMLTWHNYSGLAGKGLAAYYPFNPNSFPYFKPIFLKEYITWSHNDPINLFDVNSNNLIAKEQGKIRNPFIDMPKLIDLIWLN